MARVSQMQATRNVGEGWTRSTGLVRAGGVAAVLAGGVMVLHEWWEDRVPGIQVGVVPSALHSTWVGLSCLGFLGLSALQWHAFGRFGRLAAGLAVAGTGSLFVLALIETWGFIRADGTSQGDPPLPMLVVMFAVIGCYVAGLLLFSIATIQAGVLPRAVGIFLLMSVLLKMFASGVLPGTLALMGAAFAGMGLAALRAVRWGRTAEVEPSGSSRPPATA